MKQTTIYKEGITCRNNKFRYCDVSTSTYQCVNCDRFFGEDIKEGDHIIGDCQQCDRKNLEIEVQWRGTAYNKATGKHDGECTPYGDCLKCVEEWKNIGDLYSDFRGEGYGYEGEDYKNFSSEKFVSDREEALEKIANLPKEEIKHFLRAIHGAVER